MCGIYLRVCRLVNCGEIHEDDNDFAKISHRGQDDSQTIQGQNYFIGFQRLSIRAHKLGAQPYFSNGKVSCFNGELYNEETIRNLDPASNLPAGDMQLLGEMLMKLGPSAISFAEGMFAGFLIDFKANTISAFRDRTGEKPIYIFMDETHLCISSELRIGFIKGKIPITYGEIFQGYFDFRRMPELTVVKPATYFKIDLVNWTKVETSFWNWNANVVPSTTETKAALYKAVEKRLIADTKVCTFLSGGIDSAIVSMIAAQITDKNIEAFTLKVNGAGYDETKLAQKTADAIGINLHVVSKSDEDLAYDCLELIKKLDIPILDTSSILTYSLSKTVSKEFKVGLTGDGGDELFLGYYLFKHFEIIEKVRNYFPEFGRNLLNIILPLFLVKTEYLPLKMKLERLRTIFVRPDLPSYVAAISPVGGTTLAELFSQNLDDEHINNQVLKIQDLALYFRNYILPQVYLMKTDRSSMLNGLELRAPFLDSELIYFANKELLLQRQQGGKIFLRNYAREFLPAEVVNSPKHGFSAPFGRIMKHLDEPHWQEFFPNHLASNAAEIWKNGRLHGGNAANASWCLLNLAYMHQRFQLVPNLP